MTHGCGTTPPACDAPLLQPTACDEFTVLHSVPLLLHQPRADLCLCNTSWLVASSGSRPVLLQSTCDPCLLLQLIAPLLCRSCTNPCWYETCRWLVASSGSRPVLLQSMLDMRKRLKGAPLSGMVSVVVTDIEGYTGKLGRCQGF